MVSIRSVNEIILSLVDYYKTVQPDADTKPGTVFRDVFIDPVSSQLAILYDELSNVSNQQSLRLVAGSDLDKLAKNFAISRKQSTPSTGVAILTFSSINSNLSISPGYLVISSTGVSFYITNGISISASSSNFYKSVAAKYRSYLDTAGISDEYAVEATVTASAPGSSGNIGKYYLIKTNIPGVSNVTNINSFVGGSDQETDALFRNRILSSFNGSSVGTALGYLNTALSTTGVSDALVIEPGDSLMTRDGTVTIRNTDGSYTIVSEGTGGKVDIIVLGSDILENTDTYIYKDKSNNNDPTSTKNDIVLGQISGDENKTINRKRIDNIKNGALPTQPISSILQVTGSLSSVNFIQKTTDAYGRVSGNYDLVKDSGAYAGSPWGFDTFHWMSNKISLFSEDKIKGQFNGQDQTTFSDVLDISNAQQNIQITNENSTVTSNRSIIQLLHTPATSVTRVLNVNTGERYFVTNQNVDNTSSYNTTGRIQITGSTLPSTTDILQVDYIWVVNYDRYSDYDGLSNTHNSRSVIDSIDWGYSSLIKNERILFVSDTHLNVFTGTTTHQIDTILSVSKFLEIDGYVSTITSGIFTNRLAVVINNLPAQINSVDSITIKNTNIEIYKTSENNYSIINTANVVGTAVLYNSTIILPSDTTAITNDKVTLILNSSNIFSDTLITGSSSNNQITIPSSLVNTSAISIVLLTTYIANISDLFYSPTTSLPASRSGNGFILSNNLGYNNYSLTNLAIRENKIIQKDTSDRLIIELNISSAEYSLNTYQIISVIRASDSKELWNAFNAGTIIIGESNKYQLVLTSFNTPNVGDAVLVVYYASDLSRVQPFSYSNEIIKTRIDTLSNNITGYFDIPLNSIANESAVSFKVIEPNTDISLFSAIDGYIDSDAGQSYISSLTVNFSSLINLTPKKVKIDNSTITNNNGIYDIISYDLNTNRIFITNILDRITKNQISVIRLLDGKEIWNSSGIIDVANNIIKIPFSKVANVNDSVFVTFLKYNNLKKSPTRLISTTTDNVINTGSITINGITIFKAQDIIFTATNTGLKLNLSEALRKTLNISTATAIPSNIRIAKLIKLEKVTTAGTNDDTVLTISTEYDTNGTTIQNNLFYNEMLQDPSLQNLDFVLPNTTNNTVNIDVRNLPTQGDKLKVTFYYMIDNDYETLLYTRNGILYTNKKFALINKIYVSSGFKSSQSTKFTITSFTQPGSGTRYKVFYDYMAPKQNERISIRYNYNKLLTDVTFNIEQSRPINADVLAKEATLILLDLTMNVVIADDYKTSTTTVLQNLRDQLISTMTVNSLGQIVDVPTLINVAQAVAGIARARVLYFNKTGGEGQVLKIQAQKNEYFASNNVVLNTETR